MSCGHTFHRTCITKWFENSKIIINRIAERFRLTRPMAEAKGPYNLSDSDIDKFNNLSDMTKLSLYINGCTKTSCTEQIAGAKNGH